LRKEFIFKGFYIFFIDKIDLHKFLSTRNFAVNNLLFMLCIVNIIESKQFLHGPIKTDILFEHINPFQLNLFLTFKRKVIQTERQLYMNNRQLTGTCLNKYRKKYDSIFMLLVYVLHLSYIWKVKDQAQSIFGDTLKN
jgi:hypothetical protein